MSPRKRCADVVHLTQCPTVVDRETVDQLRELLAQAERGEIDSILFWVALPGGKYRGGLTGYFCRFLLDALAGLARLTHEVNRRMDRIT
jgi:hypothetical protein